MIYFLIAGTYTPVCLVALREGIGWWLFGIIWGLAAAGFVMTLFWVSCPRWVSSTVYIVMGWIAIAAVYPLWKGVGWSGVSQLVLKNCDKTLSIPMKGHINSLNASVAAGVLAYEVVRQRINATQ